MIEAKDTVMDIVVANFMMKDDTRTERESFMKVLKAQAEITAPIFFKAGVDEGWRKAEAHYRIDTG